MVLRIHGHSAWIESDGKPLEEYAVEINDNVISCYVCSEEGKTFVLHFDDDGSHYVGLDPPRGYGRTVDVKMDGSRVACLWGDFKFKLTSDGMRVGDIVRPYVFAPIDTTDDDFAAGDDANSEHIGTIQAEILRGINLGPSMSLGFNGTEPNTGPIHERSKKAGSHRVAFGEDTYRTRPSAVKVSYIDIAPWLVFRFLYRKRDILKAQEIVPQSPIPSPPPNRSPAPSVKPEGGKSKGKGVKREREESSNGDVIEIFSDDEDLESLQDELKRLQERISRKKAKKSVKPEVNTDDPIDLT